MNITFWSWNRV